MNKTPSMQFYPADWRKDPGVQALDYFDRGVWFEILCIMFESEPRGKLVLNGQRMPEKALARLLGLDNQILTTTLTRLLQYGVAKVESDTGIIYNRRMVEDERIRQIRRDCGSLGGNPSLLGDKKGSVLDNQNSTTGVNQIPTPSSSFSSSIHKPFSSPEVSGNGHCPHQSIIALYHNTLPMLTHVRDWHEGRQEKLRARWTEDPERQDLGWWEAFFEYVKSCPYLIGENDRGWKPNLEWLVERKNFIKVIEGTYEAGKQRMVRR